jgi:hypothetical protein
MSNTPLDTVTGWSDNHVALLREVGITTAEQVVALSATANGVRSLSEQLQVSTEEAQRLVELARKKLPPATRAELEQPVNTSDFGLGAVRPEPGENKQ